MSVLSQQTATPGPDRATHGDEPKATVLSSATPDQPEKEAPAPASALYGSFAELGAALAAKRGERGLSVQDVADRLKLSASVIGLLEGGRVEEIPHTAYAKGFLRSYARMLGVPDESYRHLLQRLAPQPTPEQPVFSPDKTARPRFRAPWLGALFSLLVACGIAFLVWHFDLIELVVRESSTEPQTVAPMPSSTSAALDRGRLEGMRASSARGTVDTRAGSSAGTASSSSSTAAVKPTASGAAATAQNSSPATGTTDGTVAGTDAGRVTESGRPREERDLNRLVLGGIMDGNAEGGSSLPVGAGNATSEGSPRKVLSLVDPGEREPLPAVVGANSPWSTLQGNATIAGEAGLATPEPGANQTPGADAAADGAVPQSGANTVVVVAESMCWTQVVVDGGRAAQRTLQPGETMSLDFQRKLSLRLGNAGGVRVFHNGAEIERGRPGQVRNLTFPLRDTERAPESGTPTPGAPAPSAVQPLSR